MHDCIDFDTHFADYLSAWTQAHANEYKTYDQMEEDLPNVYMQFLNTPADWLGRVTPGAYFTQFEDPKDLVDWMHEYCVQGVPVPELLLEQIQFVGKPCEKRLLALLKDGAALEEAQMLAVGLLRDMGSDLPKMTYINWQLDRKEKDDLCDNALESLVEMGPVVVQPMVELLPKANRAGQEAMLEVLSNFPGNEQVFKLALRLFEETTSKKALFAGYLAKLGDDRALPALEKAAADDKTGYVDYIELRCAIEELGGNAPERDFEDDPDYELLSGLGDR